MHMQNTNVWTFSIGFNEDRQTDQLTEISQHTFEFSNWCSKRSDSITAFFVFCTIDTFCVILSEFNTLPISIQEPSWICGHHNAIERISNCFFGWLQFSVTEHNLTLYSNHSRLTFFRYIFNCRRWKQIQNGVLSIMDTLVSKRCSNASTTNHYNTVFHNRLECSIPHLILYSTELLFS